MAKYLDSTIISELKKKIKALIPTVTSATGTSNTSVMSQKAVTDALNDKLDTAGGTITGNLLLKQASSNYGNKINFGDGDLVHISEPKDDELEIKAKKVNFVLSDTSGSKFTINSANPFGSGSGATITNIAYTVSSGQIKFTNDKISNYDLVIISGTGKSTCSSDKYTSATLDIQSAFHGVITPSNNTLKSSYCETQFFSTPREVSLSVYSHDTYLSVQINIRSKEAMNFGSSVYADWMTTTSKSPSVDFVVGIKF